ncbi:hypothetical protein, variant 4 [Exophiala xenobiotica]|uniref:Uncharacterized protein n=1 Tax=Exophiala xenobiotica TaxID=348802 RepID=A0A0D2FMC1_9EURO|nr:hypothetical protein, variant 1 [Exophiala xenobiotica]XP_013321860.1 hypothetical protein, variant 3 [Exophiala xenobiotica]XP_013321861.1 hypothetical protein, variant 4 [Exophiala xenobiotica]XP_013321862.1 hypothetical protein, variant 2 [Exophiala xenobiotica]XP_013321863.1 uncharacterized protein PV05_01418 [Exophiala xenobiotica]KIW61275.1 hypothetical protein PV05_01418 [Exophiala xenobiotica]KIW61276.1 hypothetical protein, variant 1 [Exophiala xenobiotica]KIW61277.1 hypothetical
MTGRRSSARIAGLKSSQESSSPPQPKSSPPGKKRKNESSGTSPTAKRGKKASEPEQKSLEETMQNGNKAEEPATTNAEQHTSQPPAEEAKEEKPDSQVGDKTESKQEDEKPDAEDTKMTGTGDGEAKKEEDSQPAKKEPSEKKEDTEQVKTNGDAVDPGERGDDVSSSILEKGIIYFFFRPRVNVDEPQDVNDVARTYMVMRPIPLDAKLGEGPIGDAGNCRLLAVPKKVLPVSGKDRFLSFVEKAKTSFKDLKESFMTGSEYATKTQGTSHVPPVTPLAEGVYAITSTGRESHIAYNITIPQELGEVQKDLGIQERGSFVTSVKNPNKPAPAGASLPKGPDYPQELLDEFRSLRWKPLEPKYLDYQNTQFLLIGESHHHDKAVEQRPKDERQGNAPPEEEMEKLEGENEIRIKHLKGDDSVFVDLGITAKDFPRVPTTW